MKYPIQSIWKIKSFFSSWKSNNFGTISLLSYGSGSNNGVSIDWEIKDNRLIFNSIVEGTPLKSVYEYTFFENNTMLNLNSITYGFSVNYTKQ